MGLSKFRPLALIAVLAQVSEPVCAQPPATPAAPPAAAASAGAPTPATPAPTTPAAETSTNAAAPAKAAQAAPAGGSGPSPEVLKKARMAGYYTRTVNGATRFCKDEAELGTRFKTQNCMSEDMLQMTFERNQQQQDQLRRGGCNGGPCGGGK